MRTICACTSYWHSRDEFNARYNGISDQLVDPLTGNIAYTLNPAYNGYFGLNKWRTNMLHLFDPVDCIIACGTWSDPSYLGESVLWRVVNAGVNPTRPHSNGWQYMGCALTALMAHVCNRRDWDILVLLEPDVLLGAVNWDSLLREFLERPEEVFGPAWYEHHCDFIGFKPSAAARFLHQRIRPNLTEDESVPWVDFELRDMFKGRAWNPWPHIRTIRQDFFHKESQWEGCPDTSEVMTWPLVRMPDPAIIEQYLSTRTLLAKPVLAD